MVVIFEIIADVMSKERSLNNRFWLLAGGTGFYLASILAWLFSLKYDSGLARGVSIFSITTLLSLIMIFWEDIF